MRYSFFYKLLAAAIILAAVTAYSNNSPKQTKNTRENLPATGKFGQPFNHSISYSTESIIERLQTENKSFALPLNISGKKAVLHGKAHYSYHSDSKAQPQITTTRIQIQ